MPPPAPAESPTTRRLSGILIAVTVLTCGLAAFVPAVIAAVQTNHRHLRRRFIWLAVAIGAVDIVGFFLLGTADTDAEGTPVGAASNIGVTCLLVAMVAGVITALVARKAAVRNPAIARELDRRGLREQYRELGASDPGMARRIGVGNPNVPRDFDDGGLVDVNLANAAVLSRYAGLTAEEAQRVVEARATLERFTSVEEVAVYGSLSDRSTASLAEVAVFI
jgi:hypothetical protein